MPRVALFVLAFFATVLDARVTSIAREPMPPLYRFAVSPADNARIFDIGPDGMHRFFSQLETQIPGSRWIVSDLSKGPPASSDTILMFEPDTDLTPLEASMLRRHLSGGGSWLLFLKPEGSAPPASLPNLESLLRDCGIEIERPPSAIPGVLRVPYLQGAVASASPFGVGTMTLNVCFPRRLVAVPGLATTCTTMPVLECPDPWSRSNTVCAARLGPLRGTGYDMHVCVVGDQSFLTNQFRVLHGTMDDVQIIVYLAAWMHRPPPMGFGGLPPYGTPVSSAPGPSFSILGILMCLAFVAVIALRKAFRP